MGIKMDKTSIIVCSVLGSLGLLSAVLGFSAEGTKLTPYTILDDGYDCIYPPNPAIGLGVCAAIFLLVTQIISSAASGCCGCCRSRSFPSETKRIVAIVCSVVSWIAAVIAIALFIDGASLNANVVRVGQAPYCTYLKDGVFAGAGILALAATALGITSFIMQRTQPAAAPAAAPPTPTLTDGGQSPAPGVVIGRPLLPMSSKPPNDYPVVKPQEYEQQQQQLHQHQVLPTDQQPHQPQQQPQGYYAQPAQNPQLAPPAAQANVPQSHHHAPSHHQPQLPPHPAPAVAVAAAAAPAVAVATAVASEPSVLQPVLGAVAVGQPMIPQVVPLPSSVHAPAAAAGNGGGQTLTSTIRNEVARQGIRMAAEVVRHSLFSSDNNNSNAAGDVIAMMTDSSRGDDAVQATN